MHERKPGAQGMQKTSLWPLGLAWDRNRFLGVNENTLLISERAGSDDGASHTISLHACVKGNNNEAIDRQGGGPSSNACLLIASLARDR